MRDTMLAPLRAELADVDRRRSALFIERDNLDTKIRQHEDEIPDGLSERLANINKGIARADSEKTDIEAAIGQIATRNDQIERALQSGNYGESEQSVPPRTPQTRDAGPSSEARSQALAANDQAEFLPADSRAHMEREIREDNDPNDTLARAIVALADRDYFRAFGKWLRDPVSGGHEWTDKERAAVQNVRWAQRSLTLATTGTAGGFLVPYELDPQILIANAGAVSPLRQISRVTTTAFNTKKFVTSLGVTAHWDPEETETTDDSPTLLQPSIDCKKGVAFVQVDLELYEDSDIAQQLGAVLADAKAVKEASDFTITATNGPTGIITALVAAGGSTVIATGTNVLAQGDLYANQAALPARWQPNAKWMMNLSILNGYRQLPQATGLNYSIVNDSTSPPTILGWPAYVNSSMDGTLTGAAADYAVLSGDFNQFAIVDRIGASVEFVPHILGANRRPLGSRGFYMHWRTGSGALISDAFRLSNFST
jgi:HK97 family phage major capsid protein